MPRKKISVTLDSKLLGILRGKVKDKTYRSLSHGIEKVLAEGLNKEEKKGV